MAIDARAGHFSNDGSTAAEFRTHLRHLFGLRAGVLPTATGTPESSLKVTEKSGTPDMSVDVDTGGVVVLGSEAGTQGVYISQAPSTTNLSISASDPTNPRKDLVIARVYDQDYASGSPSTNNITLEVVTGTPAASPSIPTVPDNSVILAIVDVAATDTSITDSEITDQRFSGNANNSNQDNGFAVAVGGVVPCSSGSRPADPWEGMVIFETDTHEIRAWDGSTWTDDYLPAGTTVHFADGSAGDPSVGFTNDADSGLYLIADGRVGMSVNGTLAYEWAAANQYAPGMGSSGTSGTVVHRFPTSTNEIYAYTSTRRVKQNIQDEPTASCLAMVAAMQPVRFDVKDDDPAIAALGGRETGVTDRLLGLIAEDVAEVDPSLAVYDEEALAEAPNDRALIALLVGAVKELQAEVEALKAS